MRTQVALEAEQHAMVKRKAAALGISIAEYIRLEEFSGDLLTSDHVLIEAWFLAFKPFGCGCGGDVGEQS